jgi:CheY-like chemotaxis protein
MTNDQRPTTNGVDDVHAALCGFHMDFRVAIINDDLAADRRLAARALRQAGLEVHTARNSVEGDALVERLLLGPGVKHVIVITDLHLPNDPAGAGLNGKGAAGVHWALRLRARMEHGTLPRVPLVALTALSEREIHMTALAFGCDAVVPKPATPDLVTRIRQALATAHAENVDAVGAQALLSLLRCRLAETFTPASASAPRLTEQHITRALLAYRRRGLVGLGESELASALLPQVGGLSERGERTYALLVHCLDAVKQLGAAESLTILRGELLDQFGVDQQCAELNISISEYYRRRREAIAVLLDLLTRGTQH